MEVKMREFKLFQRKNKWFLRTTRAESPLEGLEINTSRFKELEKPSHTVSSLGKYQNFKYEVILEDEEAIFLVIEARKTFTSCCETAYKRLFSADEASYTYDAKNVYSGGDLTSLVKDLILNNSNILEDTNILTSKRGHCYLLMTKEVARVYGLARPYNITTFPVSANLTRTKKSKRYHYQLDLSPLVATILANGLIARDNLYNLALRMYKYAGEYADEYKGFFVSSSGALRAFQSQGIKVVNKEEL